MTIYGYSCSLDVGIVVSSNGTARMDHDRKQLIHIGTLGIGGGGGGRRRGDRRRGGGGVEEREGGWRKEEREGEWRKEEREEGWDHANISLE